MSKEILAPKLREAQIVHYEPVNLRGGEISSYYVDIKSAYGNPELLKSMAKLLIEQLPADISAIGAAGYGGIPLGTAISLETGLPLSLVRDTSKNHGRQEIVDGYVPQPGDPISLVDDVFTTGSSLLHTADTLEELGVNILSCHTVVARGNTDNFAYPLHYLFVPEDIA